MYSKETSARGRGTDLPDIERGQAEGGSITVEFFHVVQQSKTLCIVKILTLGDESVSEEGNHPSVVVRDNLQVVRRKNEGQIEPRASRLRILTCFLYLSGSLDLLFFPQEATRNVPY